MKKILPYLLLCFVLMGTGVRAQDGKRLEALKIAYLTNRLNLSPQEAQRFWPVYNQYSEELRLTRVQARDEHWEELRLEESVLQIRKKYSPLFAQTLSADKVNLFYKSEKEFGNFVKNEMERRQLRQQQLKRFPANPPANP